MVSKDGLVAEDDDAVSVSSSRSSLFLVEDPSTDRVLLHGEEEDPIKPEQPNEAVAEKPADPPAAQEELTAKEEPAEPEKEVRSSMQDPHQILRQSFNWEKSGKFGGETQKYSRPVRKCPRSIAETLGSQIRSLAPCWCSSRAFPSQRARKQIIGESQGLIYVHSVPPGERNEQSHDCMGRPWVQASRWLSNKKCRLLLGNFLLCQLISLCSWLLS